ncbi:hypothetical protein KRR26_30060 [Corallococcus sp. M34]|uniref:imm11 family protein n=1 Tax=Citreicoccus inhibens TaxID=2849499 RepID=UPI001C231F1A|nr:DUF1629 domain-containing protein [Citreicoccus inhibens]MBU8899864.1 hypothetical protein [Citreicoccus inhibens]
MPYYLIQLTTCDNPDLCFLDDYPEGLGLNSYKLSKGKQLGSDYPANARVFMTDRVKGMQVPDLVSNTCSMVVTSRRVKEVFERLNQGPTEYLPVALYNHKKRVASPDHFILSPLGTVDCLNLQESEIEYHKDKVVNVDYYVLAPKKLENAPDFFRVREDPSAYIMSERIAEGLRELKPRLINFVVKELEEAPTQGA